ncbi:Tim44 domain-containing protein [Ensifer sp. ENS07]|uniref:Tim44 domain-containing protein n=3 Tax=Sinorhizobium/Ensifer group TaxID=227292 RepID=A0A9Q9D958_ENSAD|nr:MULTISPECIES: Tim44 domain-containing protein [Ensifer]MBD9497448.1 Tim44 domain-containing protein [Ensifer sp. ENS01]MBD9521346.1 Tim44 domain-containing protein [Ensifer sp. ENS02]MBD9558405.1 Tim44 domain-containing protein [Ensifer sp. ENS03]MBD9593561.1 Tim44 domain-containing protein [Ensifer sp. ENS05]MBD9640702.1 Tim44 domain-containing protein [Ensifer sp. ENS07]
MAMQRFGRFGRTLAMMAIGMVVALTVVDVAEARRSGGGFGSRGTRTFSQPPVTRTAPTNAAPIDRSMTPRQDAGPAATNPAAGQTRPNATQPNARPGFFSGFGGSLLGGLMVGGLIGMLMGGGFGGAAGFLGLIVQMLLIGGLIMLAMRFFNRNRQQTAYAGPSERSSGQQPSNGMPSFKIPSIGGGQASGQAQARPQAAPQAAPVTDGPADEIGVQGSDLEQFEKMLKDVQAAYAAEDYGTLRRLTTPEAMSYLAEELSDNATSGVKNDVRDVHLVQGDVAEAWSENGTEFATVAMRYESIDVMRDRTTGKVISGDPDNLTEAVELWTFVRKPGAEWQVSAIQGVSHD